MEIRMTSQCVLVLLACSVCAGVMTHMAPRERDGNCMHTVFLYAKVFPPSLTTDNTNGVVLLAG